MYLKDYFRLALTNIKRKKGKFILNALSISIGVATVVFITSAGKSGMGMINAEISKMGLNLCVVKVENGRFKNSDIISVQKNLSENYYLSSVIKMSAEINMPSLKTNCVIYGGDEEILDVFDYTVLMGRNIRTDDLINSKKIVIIDNNLSERIYGNNNPIGKNLNLKLADSEVSFVVAGVTDSSAVKSNFGDEMPAFVFMPHSTLKNLLCDPVSAEVYALARDRSDNYEEIRNTLNIINNDKSENEKLIYKNMNTYKRNIDYIADTITIILAMIGAISLISGWLGVINTMIMSVSERRGEIGIKKALGQTDMAVVLELVYEAFLIMVTALVIGITCGIIISYITLGAFGMKFISDFKSIVIISAVSMVMGTVFGFLPALKTFSMNPVEILK